MNGFLSQSLGQMFLMVQIADTVGCQKEKQARVDVDNVVEQVYFMQKKGKVHRGTLGS